MTRATKTLRRLALGLGAAAMIGLIAPTTADASATYNFRGNGGNLGQTEIFLDQETGTIPIIASAWVTADQPIGGLIGILPLRDRSKQ